MAPQFLPHRLRPLSVELAEKPQNFSNPFGLPKRIPLVFGQIEGLSSLDGAPLTGSVVSGQLQRPGDVVIDQLGTREGITDF